MKKVRRSVDQSGERNPNWKGGTSRSTVWRRLTAAVKEFKINDRICARCGAEAKGKPRHNMHHKNRDRDDYSRENLEPLCAGCHATEHLGELGRDEQGRLCS